MQPCVFWNVYFFSAPNTIITPFISPRFLAGMCGIPQQQKDIAFEQKSLGSQGLPPESPHEATRFIGLHEATRFIGLREAARFIPAV